MNASFPIVIAIVLMLWGPIATIVAIGCVTRARASEREVRRLRRHMYLAHLAEMRSRQQLPESPHVFFTGVGGARHRWRW